MMKGISTLLALCLSAFSFTSAVAVTVVKEGSQYNTGRFEQNVIDLEVKVLGGYVNYSRKYSEGQWEFNRSWNKLSYGVTVVNVISSSATGAEVNQTNDTSVLIRNGYTYKLDTQSESVVYRYDEQKWIEKNEQGFKWRDRNGEWIQYDTDLFPIAYGDISGTTAKFKHNAQGLLEQVFDRNDFLVLTVEYLNNRPASVTDYSGRKVTYQYTNNVLSSVTDVSNHTWKYAYEQIDIYSNKQTALSSITDPQGRITQLTNKAMGGHKYQYCYNPAAPKTEIREVVDPDTGMTTVEQVEVRLPGREICHIKIMPAQVITTANTDHDGNQSLFSYAYNQEYKSYATTIINTDGIKIQNIFGSDGALRKQLKGDELVFSQAKIDGRKVRIDAAGNKTTFLYDKYDNVTRIENPDGSSKTLTYHANYNFPVRAVSENGVVYELKYNDLGQLVQRIEAKGKPEAITTDFTYYPNGLVKQVRRIGGLNTPDSVVDFEYDDFGNRSKIIRNNEITWKFQDFNVLGQAKTVIDGRGKTWRFEFDSYGRITKRTDPLGHSQQYAYDKVGNLIRFTDAKNASFQFSYNARNQVITATDAYGKVKRYQYNEQGIVTKTTDELGHISAVLFDRSGRVKTLLDGNKNQITYSSGKDAETGEGAFDSLNRIDFPTYSQSYQYDNRKNISQTTITQGNQSTSYQYEYDAIGLTTAITDPAGVITRYSYDAHGNLTRQETGSSVTQTQYNALGQVASFTDAINYTTEFEYDAHGRKIKQIKPGFGIWRYGYDNNDNLTSIVDPKGQKIVYQYDDANRQTKELWFATEADTNPTRVITYGYDANNALTSWQSEAFSAQLNRDNNGRIDTVTQVFNGVTKTYGYSYYDNHLVQSLTMPDGAQYQYEYDANGLMTRFKIPGQGSITTNEINWLAPVKETLPGGVVRSHILNGLLNTEQMQVIAPGGNTVASLSYSYGEQQEITNKQVDGQQTDYVYDDLLRLRQATHTKESGETELETYELDDNHNRVSTNKESNWQYDNAGLLKQRGDTTYEYDANGNQVKVSQGNSYRLFIYDARDRLVRVEDQQQQVIAQYDYDPFNRRIAKQVGNQTTYYLYNEQGLIAEYDATGAEQVSYAYHPDASYSTSPILLKTGAADNKQVYYYHNDQLGTPYKLTDNTGFVVWQAEFDSFGAATLATSNKVINNLRFPGQYFDAETGLHYNYHRYYDPQTGRYISSDPIGLAGGANTFSYAYGNPINLTDPNGLLVCGGACIAAGAYVAFEAAMAIWDAYDALSTIFDDCNSTGDKVFAGALWAAGVFLPGRAGWLDDLPPYPGASNVTKYRGGAHRDMTKPVGDGLDSHHMPAKHSNPSVHPNDGPAIQMDPHDHHLTSSNGRNGKAGATYRSEIADMINSGNMRGAMAKEIRDVRRASQEGSGSRTKYNEAIKQMLDYAKSQGMLNK